MSTVLLDDRGVVVTRCSNGRGQGTRVELTLTRDPVVLDRDGAYLLAEILRAWADGETP